MGRPGDLMIAALPEPLPMGTTFQEWPLHITILTWFRSKQSDSELAGLIKESITDVHPFAGFVGSRERFGSDRSVPVRVVREPNDFTVLHHKILEAFRKRDDIKMHAKVHVSDDDFHPHLSLPHGQDLEEETQLNCDRLFLVELTGVYPGGALKTIKQEILLNAEATS